MHIYTLFIALFHRVILINELGHYMEKIEIKILQKVLTYIGWQDLTDLLRHSASYIEESSMFGSR